MISALQTSQIKCQQKSKTLGLWKNGAHDGVRIFWENLIFWDEIFFRNLYKIFCGLYEYIQGIWKVHLAYIFASVRKPWPYDTPIRFYVRKTEILKKWSSKWGWNILTNPPVCAETFFQRTLEKFLWTSHTFHFKLSFKKCSIRS